MYVKNTWSIKGILILIQVKQYVHSMINSCQHLHHELWVQQHAVARFSPKLLLLSREATHTHSEEGKENESEVFTRFIMFLHI